MGICLGFRVQGLRVRHLLLEDRDAAYKQEQGSDQEGAQHGRKQDPSVECGDAHQPYAPVCGLGFRV